MFQALIYSSSGGTVYTAIGIFYVYYVGWLLAGSEWTTPTASQHNTHKNSTVRTVPPDDEQISARKM
jgi:hypothetical protein